MKRVAATALLAMGLLQVGAADEPKDASAAGAQAAAEQARAEVAKQLRAQASEFTVVTVEPAQWSDSSLGCRKPNSMYQTGDEQWLRGRAGTARQRGIR